MTATDEMRCAKCGRTVKRGLAYGYACPRGRACGPFEPIQDVRVHRAPSALCSPPTAQRRYAVIDSEIDRMTLLEPLRIYTELDGLAR